MATTGNIKKTMEKLKFPQEVIAKMEFDGMEHDPVFAVIEKMDELLTEEQRYAVMERLGCCKSGKRDKDCKEFAELYKNRSFNEKLGLIKNVQYMADNRLNDDGTLSIFMGCIGMKNNAGCSCGGVKNQKNPVSITYCGCCGGHFRYHYQNALGIKLKLIKIKPGEFVYKIVD